MILIANNDVSCNLIIIQSFNHHEDASLALWALFNLEDRFADGDGFAGAGRTVDDVGHRTRRRLQDPLHRRFLARVQLPVEEESRPGAAFRGRLCKRARGCKGRRKKRKLES